MRNLGKMQCAHRTYYTTSQEPHDNLTAEGYTFDGGKVFEWSSPEGVVSASIRHCANKGWYILFVA